MKLFRLIVDRILQPVPTSQQEVKDLSLPTCSGHCNPITHGTNEAILLAKSSCTSLGGKDVQGKH
ncbi:hypothetical protein CsSME_00008032 [Camellia sinensis var. sinensis]